MNPHITLWHTLQHLLVTIENRMSKELQHHGIGLSEFRALHALMLSPNRELRMQDLSAQLNLNQSSVTRLVERLERQGYTIRDTCPNDKRGIYTVMTDRGIQTYETTEQAYQAAFSSILSEMKTHESYGSLIDQLFKLS